jgi:hypothetical protein
MDLQKLFHITLINELNKGYSLNKAAKLAEIVVEVEKNGEHGRNGRNDAF